MIRSCPAAIAMPVALAAALYVAAAQADIYTWTDANGRVNISNLEPPKDAKISKVVRTTAPKTTPEQEAAHVAAVARDAEVQALENRVRELEIEAEVARRVAAATPPPPAVDYRFAQAPMPYGYDWAPQPAYSAPSPGYGCDPSWFGCSGYYWGYPSTVVVVNQRGRRFPGHQVDHRFDGRAPNYRPVTLPPQISMNTRRR